MRTFRRITLLGLFAALGIGLAIWVGTSVNHGTPPKAPTRQLAAAIIAPDDPPAKAAHTRSPSAVTAAPILVAPTAPIAAEYPPRPAPGGSPPAASGGLPAVHGADRETVEKALEYLQQRMTPPSPAPGSSLPPTAAPITGGRLSPSGAAAKSPKPVVKADPEGDGKLIIHIQNSELREVLDLLSEQGGLNILAGKEVQGKVSATLSGVDINSALDAILKSTGYVSRRQGKFIFVGTPDEFNNMEQALDHVGTRVYRPNYVTAAELKTLIQPLLTEKTGVASVSSPAEAGIAANDTTVGGDKYAGGDVVLVRDYEAVLCQVDQMVAEVDIRPLQVAIEAMILSVKLADTDTFGVNFELLRDHLKFGWGSPLAALKDMEFKGGLKFGYLDHNVGAFVDALEQVADTNVIATPRLMVLNKHRAEILIGEKKGYISTTVTETASTQAVDFLEIGAQLRLRPFISRDGLIRMEIHPELSDGDVKVENNFTLPNKTLTEVTTNIMVRDGCTVVIGGLIKDQKTNSTTQIPVLGNLPWLGILFRNTTETTERHEVIVLVTPHIVYEPGSCQEGEKAACEFHRRHDVYSEKMNPLGKRHIGRRYFRLAQAAWAKGDGPTALRFAEMAIQFDPENRAAIDLRSDIWQGRRVGDHTLDAAAPPAGSLPPAAMASAGLLDGPQIAPWVLDDLGREGPPCAPLHPLDPGQPGTHVDLERPRRLQ